MSASRAVTLALVAAAGATLIARAPASAAPPTEVRIAEHQYVPAEVTVQRGATVHWVNEDDDPHTVTSDKDAFSSRGMDKREDWSFTFDAPGTYPYHCALHPTMTGTVVVK